MNPETLVAFWSAPDNSRLTPKQYTFRLPTHVAAKLRANRVSKVDWATIG